MPLEVCIDSPDSAYESLFGEASRVEICSELSVGGLTPSLGLYERIHTFLSSWPQIERRCMIRPRGGDFVYKDFELDVMEADIRHLREAGTQGFVFGVLRADYTINEHACKRLISAAEGLPCTLHRCFDWTSNWREAMETAARLGFDTILTSGQKPTVGEAVATLGKMHEYAQTVTVHGTGRSIQIMAGSGLNAGSLHKLLSETRIQWFHSSASNSLKMAAESLPPFPMGPQDSELRKGTDRNVVKMLANIIREAGR